MSKLYLYIVDVSRKELLFFSIMVVFLFLVSLMYQLILAFFVFVYEFLKKISFLC